MDDLVVVDKFPTERVSWGNGVKFLRFCNTNFSLYQVSQLIVFNLKSDMSVLRHRENTLLRCLTRRFRSLVIQGLSCLRKCLTVCWNVQFSTLIYNIGYVIKSYINAR